MGVFMAKLLLFLGLTISFQALAITRTIHCDVQGSNEDLMVSLRGGNALIYVNDEHTQTLSLDQQDPVSEVLHYKVEMGHRPVQESMEVSFNQGVNLTIDGNKSLYTCH
jgi:hypothetical protein